jgi:hypothetical protein
VGLLFVPQVTDEHGEPLWNYISRENRFVCQSSLAILPAVIWQQTGGTGEINDEFGLTKYLCSFYDMGPNGFTSSPMEGMHAADFCLPYKSITLGWV